MQFEPTHKIIFESVDGSVVPTTIESYPSPTLLYGYSIGDKITYYRDMLDDNGVTTYYYDVTDVKHELHETCGIVEQHVVVFLKRVVEGE